MNNIQNLDSVNNKLKKIKEYLIQKYKIKEIGIFGSYVRGEENKSSDIDILVSFDEIPSLLKFIEIENYLTDVLKVKTDLVRKEALRIELKNQILNEVLYI